VSNRNWPNKGNTYSYHCKPVLVDCSFIVDSTNGNGLGQRSKKSAGLIKNVFMHTTASPGKGPNGYLNPNPAAGIILVQFADNYNRYLGGFSGQVSALSGTPLTSTTNHTAYTIVSLGTATTAQWVAAGLPIGVTPAVGASFIATATGTIGGSAAVEATAAAGSGIDHIEVLGDINQTLSPSPQSVNGIGGWAVMQCFSAGTITAPADGTAIGLTFYFDDSTVLPGDGG
jgi:hypothetical protein